MANQFFDQLASILSDIDLPDAGSLAVTMFDDQWRVINYNVDGRIDFIATDLKGQLIEVNFTGGDSNAWEQAALSEVLAAITRGPAIALPSYDDEEG